MSLEVTLAVINELGGFKNSVEAHCKSYLVQKMGLSLGYSHQWQGVPVSSGLYNHLIDYRERQNQHDEIAKKLKFTRSAKIKLNKVKKLMTPVADIPKDRWVEMLATIHYFRNVCYSPKELGNNWQKTYALLNQNRKKEISTFSEPEFKLAWQRLKEYNLLNDG